MSAALVNCDARRASAVVHVDPMNCLSTSRRIVVSTTFGKDDRDRSWGKSALAISFAIS